MSELKDMCDEVRPVGPDALAEGRLRVIAAAGRAGETDRRRRPAFRRGWTTGLVAVGAATAVGAGVLALGSGTERPGTGTSTGEPVVQLASATEVLNRAADAAAKERDLNPRDDQYLRIRSVMGAKEGQRRDYWRSVDGSRTSVLRTNPCTITGKGVCDMAMGKEPPDKTYAYYRKLPTDPKALEAWLYKDVGRAYGLSRDKPVQKVGGKSKPTLDERVWDRINDDLVEQYVPPKLRAAMFTVAGRIQGSRVVDGLVDPTGRKAVAVTHPGRTWAGEPDQLVFDRRTFQFIGLREKRKWTYTLLDVSVTDSAPKAKPRPELSERRPA